MVAVLYITEHTEQSLQGGTAVQSRAYRTEFIWWQYCTEQSIKSRVYMVAVLYSAEYTEHREQGGTTVQKKAYRAEFTRDKSV